MKVGGTQEIDIPEMTISAETTAEVSTSHLVASMYIVSNIPEE